MENRREAVFIKGLQVELAYTVPIGDGAVGVPYHTSSLGRKPMEVQSPEGEEECLYAENPVNYRVIKTHLFRKNIPTGIAVQSGKPELAEYESKDTYIAMSPEVEEYLLEPLGIVAEERDRERKAREAANRYNRQKERAMTKVRDDLCCASFWQRLLYAFTGDFTHLAEERCDKEDFFFRIS